MARGGHLGFEVFIQNSAPLNPAPGDFWFDTSGGTVLNFRTNYGSWLAVSIPTAALDTLSNSVSVLSQAVSVLSQSVSAISQSLSALSQAVSILSQTHSALSNAVSVLSNAVSVLSQQVSVLSNAVSVISQAQSVLSAQVSVLSQQVSVLSVQVVSVITLHNALSQVVSVISQQVSVISAGLGGVQLRWVSVGQGISSTAAAGAAISGLSVSVAAAGIYQIQGQINYQMSVADAFGISFTFPAMVNAAATIYGANATGVSAPLTAAFNEDASNSIVYSAVVATAASTIYARFDGLFNVSAAGTIQANARVSAAAKPANVLAGSYIRAYKIV